MVPHLELLRTLVKKGIIPRNKQGIDAVFAGECVYSYLKNLGSSHVLQKAGLIHFIYEMPFFQDENIDTSKERWKILDVIGGEVDRVVWFRNKYKPTDALKKFAVDMTYPDDLVFREDRPDDILMDQLLTIEAAVLLFKQELWQEKWIHKPAEAYGIIDSNGWGIHRQPNYTNYVSGDRMQLFN